MGNGASGGQRDQYSPVATDEAEAENGNGNLYQSSLRKFFVAISRIFFYFIR